MCVQQLSLAIQVCGLIIFGPSSLDSKWTSLPFCSYLELQSIWSLVVLLLDHSPGGQVRTPCQLTTPVATAATHGYAVANPHRIRGVPRASMTRLSTNVTQLEQSTQITRFGRVTHNVRSFLTLSRQQLSISHFLKAPDLPLDVALAVNLLWVCGDCNYNAIKCALKHKIDT